MSALIEFDTIGAISSGSSPSLAAISGKVKIHSTKVLAFSVESSCGGIHGPISINTATGLSFHLVNTLCSCGSGVILTARAYDQYGNEIDGQIERLVVDCSSSQASLRKQPSGNTAKQDFNGYGRSSFTVWRPDTGTWIVQYYGLTPKQRRLVQWGRAGDVPVPGDYDGDGWTDFAVWRPEGGLWCIKSGKTNIELPGSPIQFGRSFEIPVPGDYNGDGKTELAVWKPETGDWFIRGNPTPTQWGRAGDIPVPADYDGDGKTDIAVWRPEDGVWYIINSSNSVRTSRQWGRAGDIPVPADYDGDGKTDIAVWRPEGGIWCSISSKTNLELPTSPRYWGKAGQIPVPGDYNGDGKAEEYIWNPENGDWLGPISPALYPGRGGDIPIPC